MTEKRQPKFFYGYIVVVAGFVCAIVFGGTLYTFGVFFEPVLTEFGWTRAMVAGAFSLYSALNGLLAIVAGRLTDRIGPRVVVAGAGFSLGLGCILMSQVNAVWQLYLFYGVLVGIGMSATFIPQLSLVARWFIKRRAMATGLVMAGDGVGIMIAPPLATWLISIYGWRTSYMVVGIIAAALVILAAQFLKREPSEMGLLPYGANKPKEENSHSEAVGFSLQQAIHTRQFWLVCALSFFLTFNIAPITVHIVIHAIGLGVSAVAAAGILSILGGLTLAGRLIWGALADRIGNELVLILGFVLISCALFWLLAANDLWMFYLFAAILGFGIGCWVAIIPLMGKLFGLRSHGALLGCAYSGSMAGGAIGAPLAGHIFDIACSYQLAWAVCAGASIIAIILALLLRQASRGRRRTC